MNLTESIKNVLINESTLKWETSDENTGAQEANNKDGSKFTLKNVSGKLIVSFVPKGGASGNQIFSVPANQPMAFMKAKQAAENFAGTKFKDPDQPSAKEEPKPEEEEKPEAEAPAAEEQPEAEAPATEEQPEAEAPAEGEEQQEESVEQEDEELSHDRDWGTSTLTQQNKEVTPGQTNEVMTKVSHKGPIGYRIADIGPGGKESNVQTDKVWDDNERLADIESLKKLIAHPDTTHAIQHYGTVERYRAMLQSKLDKLQKQEPTNEAYGQSGLDVSTLASKMGFAKPTPRTVDGQTAYRFKGVTTRKLRAGVENAGYSEIESYEFGDDIITDHKKGDVVLRIGPIDNGSSSWLTIISDYKDYSPETDLYQEAINGTMKSTNEGFGWIDKDMGSFGQVSTAQVGDDKYEIAHKAGVLHITRNGKLIDKSIKDTGSKSYDRAKLRAQGLSLTNEVVSGAQMVTLKASDKLEVKYGSILVNGRPFEATDPDESQDWPKTVTPDGKLVTWFKGKSDRVQEWKPEEITGYYTDREGLKQESVEISKHSRMISLITGCNDRELIESFLIENEIKGRECELSEIRSAFDRFSKRVRSTNK